MSEDRKRKAGGTKTAKAGNPDLCIRSLETSARVLRERLARKNKKLGASDEDLELVREQLELVSEADCPDPGAWKKLEALKKSVAGKRTLDIETATEVAGELSSVGMAILVAKLKKEEG